MVGTDRTRGEFSSSNYLYIHPSLEPVWSAASNKTRPGSEADR